MFISEQELPEGATDNEHLLFLTSFAVKYNVPLTGIEDLLDWFLQFRPEPPKNKALTSIYHFKKYLKVISPEAKVYFFCCESLFIEDAIPSHCPECTTSLSRKKLAQDGKYFIQPSLKHLIRLVLEEPTLEEKIKTQSDYQRQDCANEVITDVHNTDRYRAIVESTSPQFSEYLPQITINFNLDGVAHTKSLKSSMYPLQVTINELPPRLRSHHILIPFLFIKRTVDFKDFMLNPLLEECKNLYYEGVTWNAASGLNHTTQVILFSLNTDSVQKPTLLGIAGHGGYNACPKCLQPGRNVKKGNGDLRAYPCPATPHEERTLQDLGQHGQTFMPLLRQVPGFHIYRDTGIDSMHCIYLGVFKTLFKILFKDNAGKGKPFFLGADGLQLANEIMENVRSTSFLTRGIRLPTDSIHWKAHEWREWGLLYSVYVLHTMVDMGRFPRRYYEHWLLLSVGVGILNSSSITPVQLKEAERLLHLWSRDFTELYTDKNCLFNLHLVVHLPSTVARLGPLWCTSLFQFENYNTILLNSMNGPRYILEQITSRLGWRHSIERLRTEVSKQSQQHVVPLVDKMMNRRSPMSKPVCKGSYQMIHLTEEQSDLINSVGDYDVTVRSYERVSYRNLTFSTYSYSHKNYKQDLCYFYSNVYGYGRIDKIVIAPRSPDCLVFFNPVNGSNLLSNGAVCPYILSQATVNSQLKVMNAECLNKQTITMHNMDYTMFLMYKPNDVEGS